MLGGTEEEGVVSTKRHLSRIPRRLISASASKMNPTGAASALHRHLADAGDDGTAFKSLECFTELQCMIQRVETEDDFPGS